jgi:hypothetical protein
MVIRKLILTLALGALVLPSFSFANAEHRATVLLRNGDRIAGVLEDVEGGVVFVRVSLHDQRKLGVGDVALIDFVGGGQGLPESELSAARGPQHVAILRDGSSLTGQFLDIRGGEENAPRNEAYTLVFRLTNGEERRIGLDGVGRIYLGNFPGGTGTTAETQPGYTEGLAVPAGGVRVPANQAWVATGITVRRGDLVSFSSNGRIQLSSDAGDIAHSAGSLRQRTAAGSPLPQNFAGALIGRVGNSAPFPIGDNTAPITMPAAGVLYLGINDDEVGDNRGEYVVTITRSVRR